MRLGFTTNKPAKFISRIVGIVQTPTFQHHFLDFLFTVLLASQAEASLLQKETTSEMTNSAKEVQIGEVVSTWTSPDPDQKMYFTYVKVRVEKTLKGKPAQEILFRQPGGRYKNPATGKVIVQKVFGMETFQQGEKALFFVTYANDGAPMIMFQGKRQILKDKETGIEMAVQDTNSGDVEFADRKHHQDEDHEQKLYAAYDERPLDEMVLEIQKAVNSNKRRP